MKRFYDAGTGEPVGAPIDTYEDAGRPGVVHAHTGEPSGSGLAAARIAVYDDLRSTPRVEEVASESPAGFIEALAARTYEVAREQGGAIPYTVIREVVENLIHAHFEDVVVSVLDGGATIRFSDSGPGIEDKERSFVPGFSTATSDMKSVIRGVGSGLPIVKEYLSFSGGYVAVEDNLGTGTVVTLTLEPAADAAGEDPGPSAAVSPSDLPNRQKQVLSLVMELGSVGPTVISQELGVGLSTAYRDLSSLEEQGLLTADETGKRSLTESGVSLLDALFAL